MYRITFVFLAALIFLRCGPQKEVQGSLSDLRSEIHQELYENILKTWYPACIDTVSGGYLSNFDAQFHPLDHQNKMIVTQARHLWTTSTEALEDPSYLAYARHGFPFIQKMWDEEHGGFYHHVDQAGRMLDGDDLKTAYGNAFAIYGLSAYFKVSRDSLALALARETFRWLERHSHDTVHYGYFEHMYRDGSRFIRTDTISSTSTLGYKDHNSSIHLLEAFTALYEVWPDPLVHGRLSEMFHLVKDTIINDEHYMDLYFTQDWTPVTFKDQSRDVILQHAWVDHVSFGHDIETAFLLLEAAEVLGVANENLIKDMQQVVDRSLRGWDPKNGGLFDRGYYFRPGEVEIIEDSKAWWAQAETLNTLLIFHSYFPQAGYDELFQKQWKYIKTYLRDTSNGGWYPEGLDTRPEAKDALKGQIWKSTYHNYRALDHCLKLLDTGSSSGSD